LFQNSLNRYRIIRSLLTSGLLGLFALAITPKVAIHALVAHHRDVHLQLDLCTADQLNTASFHCPTDNLVVELPFIYPPFTMRVGMAPGFPVYRAAVLVAPLCRIHPLYGLRGPPAACAFA
jgi:hypothetical protein